MIKKILSQIILLIFVFQTGAIPAYCAANDSFNLAGVIESIINYQNKSDFISDIEPDAKENYTYATKNFSNGNVVVAYSEYAKTIDKLDKNSSLLMFSKKLYDLGLFSLADNALSKISDKTRLKGQIEGLKSAYSTSYKLSNEEEIYLTKIYASIFYNNSPEEAAFDLIKKTALLEKSDYANYIMANTMFECKQYNQALNYINKAIDKNNINSNYKFFKAKALLANKNFKEALKYINENENIISVYFLKDFKILKENVLSNLASNDADKKYHKIYAYYIEGDYYKVLKETQNILSFYNNSPKILALQGMAHLALGDKTSAYKDLKTANEQNKNFDLTIMGLADCSYIDKNYKEAYKGYKKLFNTEFRKEALLKAVLALENINPNDKQIAKLNKQIDLFKETSFYEYYTIANNILKDDTLKKTFVARALAINILDNNTWDILFDINYKAKNFDNLKKIVSSLLFMGSVNSKYYYYTAVVLDHENQKKEAFFEVKKSVSLNPNFKPALDYMNKLEDELI